MKHRHLPAELLSESQFTAQLAEVARLLHYRRYHTFTARRSPRGFPDEVWVRPPRVIFAEVKTEEGRLSDPQILWLNDLAKAGQEVYLWRPEMLDEIAAHLRHPFRPPTDGPGSWA
jgi:hypothetical protein